jgi:hypothetical protein
MREPRGRWELSRRRSLHRVQPHLRLFVAAVLVLGLFVTGTPCGNSGQTKVTTWIGRLIARHA